MVALQDEFHEEAEKLIDVLSNLMCHTYHHLTIPTIYHIPYTIPYTLYPISYTIYHIPYTTYYMVYSKSEFGNWEPGVQEPRGAGVRSAEVHEVENKVGEKGGEQKCTMEKSC